MIQNNILLGKKRNYILIQWKGNTTKIISLKEKLAYVDSNPSPW
jgi:hypothetical protein